MQKNNMEESELDKKSMQLNSDKYIWVQDRINQ